MIFTKLISYIRDFFCMGKEFIYVITTCDIPRDVMAVDDIS